MMTVQTTGSTNEQEQALDRFFSRIAVAVVDGYLLNQVSPSRQSAKRSASVSLFFTQLLSSYFATLFPSLELSTSRVAPPTLSTTPGGQEPRCIIRVLAGYAW
eukprot:scaffold11393_cov30-Tisochrysis_lutea.AAC.6